MHRVTVLAVGRLKSSAKYLEAGLAQYQKLLSPFLSVTWVELDDVSPSNTVTVDQAKGREAAQILKWLDKHHLEEMVVVALSETGQTFTSSGFAQWLDAHLINPPAGGRGGRGTTDMLLIVGGAYGLAPSVLEKATMVWSLSPLTFPHTLVRLILIEQLYRAVSIVNGSAYHK